MKRILRLLVIEDDDRRVERFREWLPDDVAIVHAKSGGRAVGILQRDRGAVYAGLLLDHDLQQQAATDADRELSGSRLVDIIARNIDNRVPVLVHSTNRNHGPTMAKALEARGFAVDHIPMDELTESAFSEWFEYVRDVWEDE